MHYRSVNACIKRNTNASTLCEKVVMIGQVTSEFKKGVCGMFAKTGKKLAYSTKYLSNYWTDLYRAFSIGSHICEIIKLALVLRSLKGAAMITNYFKAFLNISKLSAFTLHSGILKWNALSLCECTY